MRFEPVKRWKPSIHEPMLIRLHRAGLNLVQIAKRMGFSDKYIGARARELGLAVAKGGLAKGQRASKTIEREPLLIADIKSGKTIEELCKLHGLMPPRMKQLVRELKESGKV